MTNSSVCARMNDETEACECDSSVTVLAKQLLPSALTVGSSWQRIPPQQRCSYTRNTNRKGNVTHSVVKQALLKNQRIV